MACSDSARSHKNTPLGRLSLTFDEPRRPPRGARPYHRRRQPMKARDKRWEATVARTAPTKKMSATTRKQSARRRRGCRPFTKVSEAASRPGGPRSRPPRVVWVDDQPLTGRSTPSLAHNGRMSGPRDYSVGTRHALFAVAQGTCYFPDCDVPVVKAVEGFQTTNVQIAHIYGANPGSARYDPSMTDDQRASFDNLLLLCKPHHDLVDILASSDWPAQVLEKMKAAREISGTADALRGQTFRENELEEMLREVMKGVAVRAATVEVTSGIHTAGGWMSLPVDAVDTFRDLNPHLRNNEGALVTTIKNIGLIDSFVSEIGIYLRPEGARGEVLEFTLLGRNDYPLINPPLPKNLRVGESSHWLTGHSTIRSIVAIGRASSTTFSTVWAQVRFATGETVQSQDVAITSLPHAW